jgi:hypothetical protein
MESASSSSLSNSFQSSGTASFTSS